MSHHIISYIISNHISHIVPYIILYTISYHVIYHITSYNISPYHIMPYHIILYRIIYHVTVLYIIYFAFSFPDLSVPTNFRCAGVTLPPGHIQWHTHTHTHTHTHSVGLLWTGDQPVAKTSTWQHTTLKTDTHYPGGIRSHISSYRAATDQCLRPRGHVFDCVRINQIFRCDQKCVIVRLVITAVSARCATMVHFVNAQLFIVANFNRATCFGRTTQPLLTALRHSTAI